jgi:hypothetical protein
LYLFVLKNGNNMAPVIIASLISAAAGLAGSLWGGSKAGKAHNKITADLNQQEAENRAWYNSAALGDYTQRKDAQSLLRNLKERLDKQNRAQANTAIVTGATPEQQAVQKELSNKTVADVYSQIGAYGQSYKDRVTDRYMAMRSGISNRRAGILGGDIQSGGNLMDEGVGMIGSAAGSVFGNLLSKAQKS